jgi:hypothetical protein
MSKARRGPVRSAGSCCRACGSAAAGGAPAGAASRPACDGGAGAGAAGTAGAATKGGSASTDVIVACEIYRRACAANLGQMFALRPA